MIVLKDKDLSTVWQEFRALHALKPQVGRSRYAEETAAL
jgi:hypothetical protein